MSSNYEVQQLTYREQAESFFSNKERYERLLKIAVNGDRIYSVIFYFVKEFEKGRVVQSRHGGYYRICDEYRNAITNHKKRYYDFESKEGKGQLVWKGATNPRVLVNAQMGSIALPLPRLVAMQWFIQYDFDLLFWDRRDEVVVAFTEFTTSVKRKYTEAHKTKKRADRVRVEREVIEARTGPPRRKGKKSVYLTREERQKVSDLLVEERKKRKRERQQGHTSHKSGTNRRTKEDLLPSEKPILVQSFNGQPITI
jgi:hypothetical protein